MLARPALLRSVAIAAAVGLLAACGNPTGPEPRVPDAAAIGILQPGRAETAPTEPRRGIWQSGSTNTAPAPASTQGIWQSGST